MLAVDLKGDLSEIDKQLAQIQPGAASDAEGIVTLRTGVSLDAATEISRTLWPF